MTEVVDGFAARVAFGGGETLIKGFGLDHFVIEGGSHIDKIYPASGKGAFLELSRVFLFYHVYIRRVGADIVVDKEGGVLEIPFIVEIVHGGDGVEIAGHQPQLLSGRRDAQDGLLADVFHFGG